MQRNRSLRIVWVLTALGVWWAAVPPGQSRAQQAGAPAEMAVEGDVKVTQQGTVELHVRGADLRRVLQLLSTQSKTNIVATKEVAGTVTADLYQVTFDQALDAVLTLSGFGHVRKGNFIYVGTAEQLADMGGPPKTMIVKVFKLNYVTAADTEKLIANVLSKDGTVAVTPAAEVGIITSSEAAGGNTIANQDTIVVHDYPENVEKITAIIEKWDVRPPQVLIEATILRASLTEKNALGIDFNALAGLDFRTLGSTSSQMGSITTGDLPTAEFDNANAGFRTDFNAGIDAGGLTVGVITNQIAFFIRALESVTDVSVLANPKLLVLNKQRGEVMVGNRDGYLTTTITETSATQTVEFIETGTQLVVRPFIYSDGFIRLEIHPEDSTGGVSADSLPFEQTTEVTTNVLVEDGHTIVIGGLFRERTSNGRAQVPGLGNLPLAGPLFRRRKEETTREEVIILITTHIIKHTKDQIASEQLKDDVQRIRLGMRQGLMWFGRERLAQSCMRAARKHLAAGRRTEALWDLNMALSMQPRMEGAMRLKERLTHQAIWAREARHSSIQYIIQKMILQELGRPVGLVIPPAKPMDGMTLDEEIRKALGIGVRPELPLVPDKPAAGGKKTSPKDPADK